MSVADGVKIRMLVMCGDIESDEGAPFLGKLLTPVAGFTAVENPSSLMVRGNGLIPWLQTKQGNSTNVYHPFVATGYKFG